jgi:hypothetical protein
MWLFFILLAHQLFMDMSHIICRFLGAGEQMELIFFLFFQALLCFILNFKKEDLHGISLNLE